MHKDARTELEDSPFPRVLFTQPHKIDPMEFSNKEANLIENPKKVALCHRS